MADEQEKRGARGEGRGLGWRLRSICRPRWTLCTVSAPHCITRSHLISFGLASPAYNLHPDAWTAAITCAISARGKCCPTPTCARPDAGPPPEDATFGAAAAIMSEPLPSALPDTASVVLGARNDRIALVVERRREDLVSMPLEHL